MGVSKRIPSNSVPKHLKLGETVVYLAHKKAIYLGKDNGREQYQMAIFCAFVPQRLEKLIWQSEAIEETLKDLEKRNVTPVIIKDGDKDHA